MTEGETVACPGYCCSDFRIGYGGGYLTFETLVELARAPHERTARFYLEQMLVPAGQDVRGDDRFDCNFFDATSRTCTNYEHRPKMCRDFPGVHECTFCTYDPRAPDVPGKLRPPLDDPDELRAFLRNRRRARYGSEEE